MAKSNGGIEALRHLTTAAPPLFLSPSPPLSLSSRAASQHLFSSLKPYAPKSPLDDLLIDGFDAEQIWQQIDVQSQPLIARLRRQVRELEKTPPEEIRKLFGDVAEDGKGDDDDVEEEEKEREGIQGKVLGEFDDDDVDEEEEGDDDVDESEEEGSGGEGGVEDKFLKLKELENYMRADEKKEFGSEKKKKKKGKSNVDDEEDDDEDDEDDELGLYGADMDNDEGGDELANARYEDFYGSKKKNDQKRKPQLDDDSEDSDIYGEEDDEKTVDSEEDAEKTSDSEEEDDEKTIENQKQNLSTHEKEQQKLQAKIAQMEQANLDPKHWFMQGEATAATRPKNSALEVDLDFEHNVRPPPVITEEFTADIEALIKKRILEGKFDEVQKAPSLQSKAPKVYKDMDEKKSGKGLGDIYEDEYVQKTGLVSVASTFSDEQKKEASMLFKKLCLKLDALSHFHFTPKPVVEDMSIQANVPALAMEEIAPVAVSDAAMLAPEEVYAGTGDIKDETELTQAEKKRNRANKKRKYKAENPEMAAIKKARETTKQQPTDGKEEPPQIKISLLRGY